MAWKVFQNNTALTAEDLNDVLAEQAVITFANATERNNAWPNPNAGQHCYLISTGRTYYYSGTKWIELLPGEVSGFSAQQVLVCTSTARPGHAIGRLIYETDTAAMMISNGSAWRWVAGNRPYCQVVLGQALILTAASDSIISNFMNASQNAWSMWDATNTNDRKVIVPWTGNYQLSANMGFNGGTIGQGIVGRITSGTGAATAYASAGGQVFLTNETHLAINTTAYLTAGAQVRLMVYPTQQVNMPTQVFNAPTRLTVEFLHS